MSVCDRHCHPYFLFRHLFSLLFCPLLSLAYTSASRRATSHIPYPSFHPNPQHDSLPSPRGSIFKSVRGIEVVLLLDLLFSSSPSSASGPTSLLLFIFLFPFPFLFLFLLLPLLLLPLRLRLRLVRRCSESRPNTAPTLSLPYLYAERFQKPLDATSEGARRRNEELGPKVTATIRPYGKVPTPTPPDSSRQLRQLPRNFRGNEVLAYPSLRSRLPGSDAEHQSSDGGGR